MQVGVQFCAPVERAKERVREVGAGEAEVVNEIETPFPGNLSVTVVVPSKRTQTISPLEASCDIVREKVPERPRLSALHFEMSALTDAAHRSALAEFEVEADSPISAATMPIIAITTISSTSVKPLLLCFKPSSPFLRGLFISLSSFHRRREN